MPPIPPQELRIDTARSGGPGGQNVNKVESKVQLRWPVDASTVFSVEEKERIKTALAHRINAEGEVMVDVDEERSQAQNRDIAIGRLEELVAEALRPQKKRKATRPTRAAKEKRLEEKRRMGEKKRMRRSLPSDMS